MSSRKGRECKNTKKSVEKFGKKEKVRIFAARFGRSGQFFDNIGKDNEVKKEVNEIMSVIFFRKRIFSDTERKVRDCNFKIRQRVKSYL